MKLIKILIASMLYCTGVQSSTPVRQPQLTQEQKNNMLYNTLEWYPESYGEIQTLKSQGAQITHSLVSFAVSISSWKTSNQDARFVRRLLCHDPNTDRFEGNGNLMSTWRSIKTLKVLAADKRFSVDMEAVDRPYETLMHKAIQYGNAESVLFLYYMGKDVTKRNRSGNSDISYAEEVFANEQREGEKHSYFSSLVQRKKIVEILKTPVHELYRLMTPEQHEEYLTIKLTREPEKQNQLQFMLNRQMGPTYAMHQQQLRSVRRAQLHAAALSNNVTDDCIVDQKKQN